MSKAKVKCVICLSEVPGVHATAECIPSENSIAGRIHAACHIKLMTGHPPRCENPIHPLAQEVWMMEEWVKNV